MTAERFSILQADGRNMFFPKKKNQNQLNLGKYNAVCIFSFSCLGATYRAISCVRFLSEINCFDFLREVLLEGHHFVPVVVFNSRLGIWRQVSVEWSAQQPEFPSLGEGKRREGSQQSRIFF